MRQVINAFYLSIVVMFFATPAKAQRYLGVASSEWNSINDVYLNPASIAGCNERVSVSLFSVNIAVDNNLGTFTSIRNLGKINGNNDSGSNVGNNIFSNSGRQKFSMLVPAFELRGPSVLVSITKKISVAVTTRIRLMNQFNNFDQSLYQQITNGNAPTSDYTAHMQNFNWTAHMWSEIGLSYGMVVIDDERGLLKVGATVRHLGGIGYLGIKAKNMDVNYYSGKDSFYASNTDLEYASNVVSADNAVLSGVSISSLFGNLFSSGNAGGFGADLGATYTRILGSGSGHRVTASVAITDIGAINYKNDNFTMNVSGTGYLTGDGLNSMGKSYDSAKAYLLRQGFAADTGNRTTKLHMPTALLIGGDIQIHGHISANIIYMANMVNRQQFGNSYYNQVTITPRFDVHVFSVGLPITYSMLAHDLKMGLGFRLGGFFLGSDDMLALFASGQYGFNAYFGGYVPITRKNKHKEAKTDIIQPAN